MKALLATLLLLSTSWALADGAGDSKRGIILRIAPPDKFLVYASDPTGAAFTLVKQDASDADARRDLIRLLHDEDQLKKSDAAITQQYQRSFSRSVLWARLSPDKRYAVLLLEAPDSSDAESIVIIRVQDNAKVLEIHPEGYFGGCAWSPDMTEVAMLERTERTGKSPLALLSAVSGHPVQYGRYTIERFKLGVGSQGKAVIPGEYENASTAIEWR